jgi:hypothetical protein
LSIRLLGRRNIYGEWVEGYCWAHAWVETKDFIVDITADQFDNFIIDDECYVDYLDEVEVIDKNSLLARRYRKHK